MKIRSVTLFSPGDPRRSLESELDLLDVARHALRAAGYEVQSVRLALTDPALHVPADLPPAQRRRSWFEIAAALEQLTRTRVDYASVGALRAGDELAAEIPALLATTEKVFVAATMSDAQGIDLETVRRLGEVVHANARLRADGFANLRFAALSRVPAGVPFLPAAYHDGGPARIAVAAQGAELALAAFREASQPSQARARFIAELEAHGARIEAALLPALGNQRWSGIDFSPATYPSAEASMGAALEALGVRKLGRHGSTAAAAFAASALDGARFRRAGFNGLFFPVLEDERLALRAAEGEVGLKDLLLWSTVCGTGLDTVPLPGDIKASELSAILLDVAALGVRLDKPLTARLMPMPHRVAGDALRFDFEYFADASVLPHAAAPLRGGLAAGSKLPIAPRRAGEST